MREYNEHKLATSSDEKAIFRAQGAFELINEILGMKEMLTESLTMAADAQRKVQEHLTFREKERSFLRND